MEGWDLPFLADPTLNLERARNPGAIEPGTAALGRLVACDGKGFVNKKCDLRSGEGRKAIKVRAGLKPAPPFK